MKKSPIPIVFSVPHGGTQVPKELAPLCALDLSTILHDGDTWMGYILENRAQVASYIETSIPRAILDMNRAPQDLPPNNPDGMVKTVTVDGNPVWLNPQGLDKELIQWLIDTHHKPYHTQIIQACNMPGIRLGIDCHSMMDKAPIINNQPGTPRPLICISNLGDSMGEKHLGPLSAPAAMLRNLQQALGHEFRDDPRFQISNPITLNTPFKGGYITQFHGSNSTIPWIQLEFNRALYLPPVRQTTHIPDPQTTKSLQELGSKLLKAIQQIL